MATMADLYKALGVPEDADDAAIKKAFRRLAKDCHPDTHPGDKKAEERFKEISQAYEILSDAEKRRRYDAMRRSPFAGQGGEAQGAWPGEGAGNINELFEMFFGRGASPFGRYARYGMEEEPQPQDRMVRLRLNLAQALIGTELLVKLGEDKLRLKVPPGSQPGTRLRLRGKGINGGDLYAEIQVELPGSLNAEEEAAVRAMAARRNWEL
jgi:DnaJ-class molecular chaperone